MTTAYTSLLGLALPVTGELSGTWGDVVNNSITSLLDSAIAGTTNVSTDGDVTLTTTTGAANTAREAILLFSGARTALRTVTAPAQSKVYTVINATTGGYSVQLVGSGPTTGVTILAGESAVCAWNGSDFVKVSNAGGSSSFVNLTVSGNLTLSGGTANGVLYLNGSKVATSGSAITYDGTTFVAPFTSLSGNGVVLTVDRTGTGGNDRTNVQFSNSGTVRGGIGTVGASDGIYFNQGTTEGMRLTSTGLGIGTSSPSRKLQVVGTAAVSSDFYGGYANANANIIASSSVANGGAGASQFLFGNTSTDSRGYLSYVHSSDSLLIGTTGTTKATLDSSGNLGLGVTPSAWTATNIKALQVKAASIASNGGSAYFSSNVNRTSSGPLYIDSGAYASAVEMNNAGTGGMQFMLAPSGTAGNAISFTQAMTLDASGNLGIGTTSPVEALDIQRSGAVARVSLTAAGSGISPDMFYKRARGTLSAPTAANGNAGLGNLYFAGYDGTSYITSTSVSVTQEGTVSTGILQSRFTISNQDSAGTLTERLRLDASGNLGLGATPSSWLWPNGSTGVFQLQAYGAVSAYNSTTYLSNNWYYNAGEKYIANGYASRYEQGLGKHTFFTAGNNVSGAGATVSWTQAMTLDASGKLFVGGTSDAALDGAFGVVVGGSSQSSAGVALETSTSQWMPYTDSSQALMFYDSRQNLERARIDSSGSFAVANGTQSASTISSKIIFGNRGTITGTNAGGAWITAISGSPNWYNGTALAFYTNAGPDVTAADPTERMRLTSTGDLLIGRTSSSGLGQLQSAGGADLATDGGSVYLARNSGGTVCIAGTSSYAKATINQASLGTTAMLAFSTPDGTYNPRAIVNYVTSSSRQYVEFTSSYSSGSGVADWVFPSGSVLVGTTTAQTAGTVLSAVNIQNGIYARTTAIANTYEAMVASRTGTVGKAITFWYDQTTGTQSGYINIDSTSTVSLNNTSDYRAKENVQPLVNSIERVKSLNPVSFNFKVDGYATEGFIAHELAEVMPNAVHGEKDAVDEDGKPVYQAIDQSKIIPLLTAAIQEQQAIIESLKARLDAANL